MRKTSFRQIKDCERIYSSNDAWVIIGKHPWIIRKDGTLAAKIKEIRYGYRPQFMYDQTVYFNGAKDKQHYFVSMKTGEVLWQRRKADKINIAEHTAVSPDGKMLYSLYDIGPYDVGPQYYVDCMRPEEQQCITYEISLHGSISHMQCDAEGNINILAFDRSVQYASGYCAYSLYVFELSKKELVKVNTWIVRSRDIPVLFDEEYILFQNLRVMNRKTKEVFSLIENSPIEIKNDLCFINGYDPNRKLLNICYIGKGSTLIVDCEKRCIVSHYQRLYEGMSSGYLEDDHFWIGTRDGVIARPFPNMDPLPKFL